MGDDGGELLRGERLRWTGQPARVRVRLAEAGVPLLMLMAVPLLIVFEPYPRKPALFGVMVLIVYAAIFVQALWLLVAQLVIAPARRRRSAYQVTDYRVLVTTGLRRRRTWSAYLDQIDEPAVVPNHDGTGDLMLKPRQPSSRPGSTGISGFAPFRLGQPQPFPVLTGLSDADQAKRAVMEARLEMPDGITAALPDDPGTRIALPANVTLEPAERVLWAGHAQTVPWWFGADDIELSAVALFFLAFLGLMAALVVTDGPAGSVVVFSPVAAMGLYIAVGRVLLRRRRIGRSSYLLTDRRLIATWRLRREPVVIQAGLAGLLPSEIRGQMICAALAHPAAAADNAGHGPLDGWRSQAWPAATTSPPALIGIRDPQAVWELICAAQLAQRAANTTR
jgi:hypothetical protein